MIRIFLLILTPLLVTHSFADEKNYIQENIIYYSGEVLCASATLKVPNKRLTCEELESNQACGSFSRFRNEIYLCKSAAINAAVKKWWRGIGAGQIYEKEVKHKGLTCGVNENRCSKPLKRPATVSEILVENLPSTPLPRPIILEKEINPRPVPLPFFVDPNSWLTRV